MMMMMMDPSTPKGGRGKKRKKDSRAFYSTLEHGPVGGIGDGEDVRRHFVPLLPLVQVDDFLRVNGQPLVRVYHHAKQSRVRLLRAIEREKKEAKMKKKWMRTRLSVMELLIESQRQVRFSRLILFSSDKTPTEPEVNNNGCVFITIE